MSLVIGFAPGDSVSIGGHHFTIDPQQGRLEDSCGASYPLSNTSVSPVAEVRVRLAVPQRWPGVLSLAFEAPRDILILRQRAGGAQ